MELSKDRIDSIPQWAGCHVSAVSASYWINGVEYWHTRVGDLYFWSNERGELSDDNGTPGFPSVEAVMQDAMEHARRHKAVAKVGGAA